MCPPRQQDCGGTQVGEQGQGGCSTASCMHLAERYPAAISQKGVAACCFGICRDCAWDAAARLLFFCVWLWFFSCRDLVSVCGLTRGVRRRHEAAQLFPHQLTPASQSCSPSNTHSLFASYAYVCVTSGFFWPETRLWEGFLRLSKPIMVLGP